MILGTMNLRVLQMAHITKTAGRLIGWSVELLCNTTLFHEKSLYINAVVIVQYKFVRHCLLLWYFDYFSVNRVPVSAVAAYIVWEEELWRPDDSGNHIKRGK
jgi:hypothetical protein